MVKVLDMHGTLEEVVVLLVVVVVDAILFPLDLQLQSTYLLPGDQSLSNNTCIPINIQFGQ